MARRNRTSRERGWFTAGIGSVGLASFFSDAGHEITTALLPSFLTSFLHASAAVLGVITGASDALIGLAKLAGGPIADEPRRRGGLAAGGYLGTALATGAVGAAAAAWQAGALRAAAWVARGLRSPARDSLLASLAPSGAYGRAFGVERAGDNLGAVAGPLLAAFLVGAVGIRPALWMAAVPGTLAALSITVAARKARRDAQPHPDAARPSGTVAGAKAAGVRTRVRGQWAALRRAGLLRPMVPIVLFESGNTAVTLLILRATQLLHTGGRTLAAATSLAVLVYAAHNALGAAVAFGGGHWIDRSGPRVVFGAGAALYVLAYAGFAIGSHSWVFLLVSFSLAGAGIGLAEPAESALVAGAVPDRLRGSAFGALGGVQAAGDLLSSVVVGVLYTTVSPVAGFGYAAGWMLLSVVASGWLAVRR